MLLSQGAHEMEQYFVIDGILKRVVASSEGKEMILRFAKEDDMDTSYAAWKLRTPGALLDPRGDQGARGEAAAAAVGRVPRAPPRPQGATSSTR